MSEIPKKKRGRKPKNKIINNPNPVFDNNSLDDILITSIKKPIKEITVDENDIKPSDLNEKKYSELNYDKKENNKCWNCCYNIEGEIYSYPTNYINNIFYTNGNFCCYQCSARYIYDNYDDKEFWDKYYLLNFYVNLKYDIKNKINIPYSKLRLIDFGGDLTKQQYIDSENITYDCFIPPTIYVNNLYYSKDIYNNKEGEFKLSRKNKKENKFLKNLT